MKSSFIFRRIYSWDSENQRWRFFSRNINFSRRFRPADINRNFQFPLRDSADEDPETTEIVVISFNRTLTRFPDRDSASTAENQEKSREKKREKGGRTNMKQCSWLNNFSNTEKETPFAFSFLNTFRI